MIAANAQARRPRMQLPRLLHVRNCADIAKNASATQRRIPENPFATWLNSG
jgi:hypothetical protein